MPPLCLPPTGCLSPPWHCRWTIDFVWELNYLKINKIVEEQFLRPKYIFFLESPKLTLTAGTKRYQQLFIKSILAMSQDTLHVLEGCCMMSFLPARRKEKVKKEEGRVCGNIFWFRGKIMSGYAWRSIPFSQRLNAIFSFTLYYPSLFLTRRKQ